MDKQHGRGPTTAEGGCSVPAGWEPVTTNASTDLNNSMLLRRCTSP